MGKNILIIEDDEFLRGLISKKLASEGFAVISAIDGEKGIEKARDQNPDLILLDLLLPNVDGYEVLQKMKENPATSHIPIIVVSNLGQSEDIDKAMKLGATDFLIKAQYTAEEIVNKVKVAIK
jgi:DNA-binding response OmpR family regulator